MEDKRPNLGANARNYSWEIKIGGPNRGYILVLKGNVFRNTEAVESSLDTLRYIAKKLDMEEDYLVKSLMARIRGMG